MERSPLLFLTPRVPFPRERTSSWRFGPLLLPVSSVSTGRATQKHLESTKSLTHNTIAGRRLAAPVGPLVRFAEERDDHRITDRRTSLLRQKLRLCDMQPCPGMI